MLTISGSARALRKRAIDVSSLPSLAPGSRPRRRVPADAARRDGVL
jgi:hypothetical protein